MLLWNMTRIWLLIVCVCVGGGGGINSSVKYFVEEE